MQKPLKSRTPWPGIAMERILGSGELKNAPAPARLDTGGTLSKKRNCLFGAS
jgi:hypothetical protein